MLKHLKLLLDNYVHDAVERGIKEKRLEEANTHRREILLTEYKEIINTMRNWDTVVYGMLTVIGTVIAAIITYSVESNNPIVWGVIISLFLFWLFSYIWITKLAEVRIDVLIEIETELNMIGQYIRLRKVKQVKLFLVWTFLPYLGAFVIGPILGYIIASPDKFYLDIKNFLLFVKSIFF